MKQDNTKFQGHYTKTGHREITQKDLDLIAKAKSNFDERKKDEKE